MKRASHWAAAPLAFLAVVALGYATALTVRNTATFAGLRKWADPLACVGVAVVVSAALATVMWRQGSRRARFLKRVRDGLCLHCGFDLRASRGNCPECGRPIEEHFYRSMGARRGGKGRGEIRTSDAAP